MSAAWLNHTVQSLRNVLPLALPSMMAKLLNSQLGLSVGAPNSPIFNEIVHTSCNLKNSRMHGCSVMSEFRGCSRVHHVAPNPRMNRRATTRATSMLASLTLGKSCRPSGLTKDLFDVALLIQTQVLHTGPSIAEAGDCTFNAVKM